MRQQTGSARRSKQGALIEWHNVAFTVHDAKGHEKRVLVDMHGFAQPGRLLAIMGPSGAGKSTLLDVLAATISSRGAAIEGSITVDGAPRSDRAFRRISSYVQQRDVLLSSATVREAVMTSALLKLPRSMPLAAKRALVEGVLKELDLTSCADTLIGDEAIGLKGISGGQKRRVSVGIELVKDPRVLFLDEPSSGLDSEMAVSVVASLQRLARLGRTVVCTIHQPNSDITDCFDDFLLLAAGRAVYGGVWGGAVDFFARAGFSCPSFKNPTDYFMAVIRDEAAADTLCTAYDKARPALLQDMAAAGAASLYGITSQYGSSAYGTAAAAAQQQQHKPAHVAVDVRDDRNGNGQAAPPPPPAPVAAAAPPPVPVAAGGGSEGEAGSDGSEDDKPAGVPVWYQGAVLSARYWRSWVRNPVMMSSELVQYVFVAVFIGLMYYRFNDVLGEGDYNRASCIWFSFAVLCFTPSYTAVTNWSSERLLLKRELSQKLYSMPVFYLARYSVVIPFQILQCLLFVSVMYFFVGFYASAANFFTFFAVFSMFQIVSEGVGACCAAVTRTPTAAIILLTFVLLVLLAFSGFLTAKVPIYFVWVQKTSYLTYAFSALLERELSSITLVDPADGQEIPGMSAFPPSLDTGLSMAQNIGILAAQVAGMEVIKLTVFALSFRFNF